jgi:sugar phosphate isomerase/epimerase
MATVDIEDAIPALAKIGYQGVELAVAERFPTKLESLDAKRRTLIRSLYATYGLELPAIAAHSSLLLNQRDAQQQSMNRIQGSMELALDIGGNAPHVVITTVGGESGTWASIRDVLVDRVGDLARLAEESGTLLAIEPHVGQALHTPEQMLELLEKVSSSALKVNFDNSHFLAQGIPVEACVSMLGAHAVNTHLKGVDGVEPNFQFLTPGEDNYDYAYEFGLMAATGYNGYQTVEISMQVQARPDYDPFQHAALAFERLSSSIPMTGNV